MVWHFHFLAEDIDFEKHPLWQLYTTERTNTPFTLLSTSVAGVPEAILPITDENFHPPRNQPTGETSIAMISPIPDPPLASGFSYLPPQQIHVPTHPPAALDIDPTYVPRSRRSTAGKT
jgi:hypothetical protein